MGIEMNNICKTCGSKLETLLFSKRCAGFCDTCLDEENWSKMPEEINYSGGPIYGEGIFFSSLNELLDYYDGDELPKYVECCDEKILGYDFDVARIINNIEECMLEDVKDSDSINIVKIDELREAINLFLQAQTDGLWVRNHRKLTLTNHPIKKR